MVVAIRTKVGWAALVLLVGAVGCGGGKSAGTGSSGGSTGSGVLVPDDPCSVNRGGCDANATCTRIAPGESACGCNPGYAGDGRTCTAIDLCATGHGGCDANATCTSTGPGTATCACNAHFAGDGGSCAPIDACATANGGCDPNAVCTATGPDSVSCACSPGYAGDGGSCAALDACAVADGGLSPCGLGASCQSTGPGTFTCTCEVGFQGDDAGNCAAIDACAQSDGGGCGAGASCQDTGPGTSTCVCASGYAGDGGSCTAVNLCDTDHGGCDPRATCTSTGPGTRTCTCPAGMVGGSTCYLPGALLINDGAKTVNTGAVTLQLQPPGNLLQNGNLASGDLTNWTAVYQLGNGAVVEPGGLFSGDRWVTSYDWDVRSQEVDLLAAGYTAAQLDGATPPVFTVLDWVRGNWPNYGDRYQLHAELRDANHNPIVAQEDGIAASPLILSDTWAPRSISFSGYPAGARYLEIADASKDAEYWAGNYGGQMADTYAGSPEFAVQLSNDGVTWSDPQQWAPELDWSLGNTGTAVVLARYLDASGQIVQTVAATIGNCPDGYTWSGDSCLDNQECEDGLAHCDANASCTDVPGSYSCACQVGYQGSGASCTPITQCGANACDPNATCSNTSASSYTCTCKSGYAGDGKSCSPVDACATAAGQQPVCPINATCTDTGPGTFSCACNSGYFAAGGYPGQGGPGGLAGPKCVPSDPCTAADPCSANATCNNPAPGAFQCVCNAGYQGNGLSCAEINPCLQPGYCHGGACTHTGPGTATCACPATDILYNNKCLTPGAVQFAGGATQVPTGQVNYQILPPGNLLANPDAADGTLNGWTVTAQPGSAPVVSSTAGLFSGKAVVSSWQWSTRSQTVDLQALGYTPTQLGQGIIFVAQECFEGTGPNPADNYFLQVDLLDQNQAAVQTFSSGTTATPHTTSSGWGCAAILFRTTSTGRYVRFTDGSRDAEGWWGNYGAAMSNAFLGERAGYERSINGSTPSGLSFVYPQDSFYTGTPGTYDLSLKFSLDNGSSFLSPAATDSVTLGP